MLDDVERWAFLVDPARKHPPPASVALLDVKLDEGAGKLLILPRRGRFARPQPHDRALHADRLAGPQPDVADDAVALVEQAEHRDPLGHRRNRRPRARRARHIEGDRIAAPARRGVGSAIVAPREQREQRKRNEREPETSAGHAQSGFHA